MMKFTGDDFCETGQHDCKHGEGNCWCAGNYWANKANEKLAEMQRATPDLRTEEIVLLLNWCKYLEEQLLIAHDKNTELKRDIANINARYTEK